MPTNFPTSLDSFTNPTPANNLSDAAVLHTDEHSNANDAVTALETKVGINNSADANSLDYKVAHIVTPQSLPNALHKWLNSYNATTGLFTQTQPDYSDLTGVPSTFPATPHNILSATHSDTTTASVVRGDLITGQGVSPTWSRLAISVPAANVLNVLGIANGETESSWKSIFDGTNPAALGSVAPGTSLIAAHRDHVHPTTGLALAATTISVSGLGLSGGGDLSANRTITLTSSSNPGAAASILASASDGSLTISGGVTFKGANNSILIRGNALTGSFLVTFTTVPLTANHEVDLPDQGGTLTLGAGTLTVSSTNDFTLANHTHAITSSSNPGAAAAILATPASGVPTLVGLKITPTASSDANTIDDYTEGTWTPTFFSTSASFTYTNQFGFYTKIGNVVHAIIYLTGTATGTVTNGLYVVLTHTQKNETGRTSVGLVGYTDCSVSPVLVGNTNSTLVNINQFGTTTQLTPTTAGMTGGTSKTFICSMTYFV